MKFPAGQIFTQIPRCSHPPTHNAVLRKPLYFRQNTSQYFHWNTFCISGAIPPDALSVCAEIHIWRFRPLLRKSTAKVAAKISAQILLLPWFLMLIPVLRFLMKSRRDTDSPIETGRCLWRRLERQQYWTHCELTWQGIAHLASRLCSSRGEALTYNHHLERLSFPQEHAAETARKMWERWSHILGLCGCGRMDGDKWLAEADKYMGDKWINGRRDKCAVNGPSPAIATPSGGEAWAKIA